ncbi:MAG TPA: tripartite tricarboxylate transporter substrate-binding protein [Xanthobacteraceae bacterium]
MPRMLVGALLACVLALPGPAAAEDWPTRPVTVVVPFAAGGPIDVVARLISPRMSELLGQQMVIDNIPGAGGMVGASRVAKAAPDGYTMLIGNQATHTYSQFLYKTPLYDPVADFAPGGMLLSNYKVLVVRKDLPANTLPEFVAYAKANAAKLQYGSGGGGSATHIACLLLNAKMGTNITHVPYRGAGPAMQDMVAGRIDFMCDVVSTALAQIRAGTVKPIAMLSNVRAAVLPNLPTALEQGLADVDADGWNALFFPKGTPAAVISRVNAAAGEMLDTPAVRKRIEELGLYAAPPAERSPDFLSKLVLRELDKWGPPIKASGVAAK